MAQERVQRRLAAILAADVVGYSRMMERDETGTLSRLKAHRREIIDPQVKAHGGRVVKSTGDGVLVEFPSAVEAVTAAVEVQKAMLTRNANVPPDQQIVFRIGINLGDLILDEGDIYGDGVNIAARLEGLAPSGGIAISRSVREQIRDKCPFPFRDAGEHQVKNIARPIRVFALDPEGVAFAPSDPRLTNQASRRYAPPLVLGSLAAAIVAAVGLGGWGWYTHSTPTTLGQKPVAATATSAGATPSPSASERPRPRLSLVVLPFQNLSSDPEQEYFADGLTEDLTTDLSQSPGTFIIARNTAFTYKGKAVNIQQVGRELGVRYALEGSVRRTGDQIRINAQLIDTESGAHVWAERFDGDRANLGTLQNTVAARLARNISVEMIDAEAARGTREGSNNPDAVDLAMKGWSIFHRAFAREPLDQAQGLFDRAIQMDPSLVSGWIGLAYVHLRKSQSRMVPDLKEEHRKAYEASDRAISLAPRNATAHFLKASTLLSEGKTQAAAPLFEKALDLNPSLAPAHAGTGFLKILSGRSSEAPAHIEQALRLSPRDPSLHAWQYFMGRAYVHMAQDAKAAEWSERSISTNPNGSGIFAYLDLAASYAHLGRDADARAMVEEVRKRAPSYTVESFRRSGFSSDPVWLKEAERFYEGLGKAGLPES